MIRGRRFTGSLRQGLGERGTLAAWGTAKAFRGAIHRMVRPLCLLTFPGGRFAFLFLWGLRAPTPRAAFEKAGETFNF